MKASPKAYVLIEQFESCAVKRQDGKYRAYPDPATGGAPWTIGWGTTGPGIGPQTVWTRAQCDEALRGHVASLETRLSDALGLRTPTTQNQFDALIDFAYNEGIGALIKSTLFMYHKAGNFDAASAQFVHWDMAAGGHMSGLARRRRAEATLYRETPHAR